MKSDRLTRKTHLKRLHDRDAGRGAGGILDGAPRLYDLTHADADADSAVLLSGPGSVSDVRVIPCFWPLAALLTAARRNGSDDVQERAFSFENDYDALVWCATLAGQSPLAHALMLDAEDHGWAVGLADLGREGFYMDVAERLILIDRFSMVPDAIGRSAFFRNAMLSVFIRALRDVWHENRAQCAEDRYAPDQLLMFERVRAADCDTVTILAGWELRGAGFTEVWRHLLGAEEGDMAMIFTRFLERDPGALFSGAALAHTFRQWYADAARVDGSDHETLEALDGLLADCDDGAGVFGREPVDAKTLEDLATLPDGTRYLAGLGSTILRDPFFAGLNDPINQTHLFHLMYDMDVVMVNNVPFRDAALARLIFPQGDIKRVATRRE